MTKKLWRRMNTARFWESKGAAVRKDLFCTWCGRFASGS